MCGIAGILRFNGGEVHYNEISTVVEKMSHRGRDNTGIVVGRNFASNQRDMNFEYPGIGLGHKRLSIIDLDPIANQPMSYSDGRLWISFNGEIYNYIELRLDLQRKGYSFKTASDTEVILAAYEEWGKDCIELFNGMFSFALWDQKNEVLFCARDHIGIKPFYYMKNDDHFVFASESQALNHYTENRINEFALSAYLLCNYVPGCMSIFEGVEKLEPGCSLTVNSHGETKKERYWRLGKCGELGDSTERKERLNSTITSAIRRQLRSDVKVGAFVSGGIDSSIIVALASRAGEHLHTFSVGYEGDPANELPYARQISKRYGTSHHELFLPASSILQNLDMAVEFLTEPVADSAMVPTFLLSQMAASEGVKVLLSGTGGDEVFGGYERYDARRSGIRRFTESVPIKWRTTLGNSLPLTWGAYIARLRHLGFDLMLSTGGSSNLVRKMLDSPERFAVFVNEIAHVCYGRFRNGSSVSYQRMILDLGLYLPDQLLFFLDQITMAFTLEGRVPLVDIEIIREAFGFPSESHVEPGKTKKLLRELSMPLIGNDLAYRRKKGFGGPVPIWMNENRVRVAEVVRELPDIPHLAGFPVTSYLSGLQKGTLTRPQMSEVFQLYCLVRWFHSLRSSTPAA